MGVNEAKTAILENRTALGIEFGSTRIKAVLVDDKNQPIASGAYEWENQYVDGIWTYSLEEIWKGLQGSYQDMAEDVQKKYGVELTSVGAFGVSAMMHGYMPFNKEGELMVPFVPGETTSQEKPLRSWQSFSITISLRDGASHTCIRRSLTVRSM